MKWKQDDYETLFEVESRKLMIFLLVFFLKNYDNFKLPANHVSKLISYTSLFCISHAPQNTPNRKLKRDNIKRLLRDNINPLSGKADI